MDRSSEILSGAVNIGRWSISERESRSGITVNDAAGRSVGRVPPRDDDLDIARLIASAPDLLAALEEALAYCETGPLRERAISALKKARGE